MLLVTITCVMCLYAAPESVGIGSSSAYVRQKYQLRIVYVRELVVWFFGTLAVMVPARRSRSDPKLARFSSRLSRKVSRLVVK